MKSIQPHVRETIMNVPMAATAMAAAWSFMLPELGPAQVATPDFKLAGDWQGTLYVQGTELPLVFHFLESEDGTMSGSLDSPAQGATGLPISEVAIRGDTLVVEVSSVGGQYQALRDGDRFTGKWRQGATTLPLDLIRVPAGESAFVFVRPQHPTEPYPYQSREVEFDNVAAGIRLAGTLTLPATGRGLPGVILISGSGPQDRDETVFGHRPFLVLADHLTRSGIAVLRFDDRGVGRSSGDFSAATTEDFASDVEAALDYLAGRPEVNAAAIGLIGHSEGGLVAPMVAAESERVAFVVLLAGPGTPGDRILINQAELIARASGLSEEAAQSVRIRQKEILEAVTRGTEQTELEALLRKHMQDQLAGLTDEEKDARIQTQLAALSSPWFRYFLAYDPVPALRKVRVPVLALTGELDLQVPYEENLSQIEEALVSGGNPDVTVVSLAGHNHLLQEAKTGLPAEYAQIEQTISPTALDLVSSWILERVH
ncbi:MAG: alpha/beta fold hydrolase [Gemmatimonadota bacterium]